MSEQLDLVQALDRKARETSVTEFERPIVLEAGAGTGKTAVLVARVLFWCLGPGWRRAEQLTRERGERSSPEQTAGRVLEGVTAITFTDRAAAEMGDRVADGLSKIVAGRPVIGLPLAALALDADRCAERAAALLAAIDRLEVSTIHAFCRRLLARSPLEAGVHPSFEVDADGQRTRRLIEEVLNARLHDPSSAEQLIALAAHGYGPAALCDALEHLVELLVPSTALLSDGDRAPYGTAAVERAAARLADALRTVLSALEDASNSRSGRAAQGLRESVAAGRELLGRLERAQAAEDLRLIAGAGELGRLQRRAERLAREEGHPSAPRLLAALDQLRMTLANVRATRPEVLPALYRFLSPLLDEVYRRMRSEGIESFSALLRDTRDLLIRHPALLARLRRSIAQLLVDEFQDTDPLQCEVIELLALPDQVQRGEGRPGLFLVGDPKQSIYGWRSADLAAYDAFVERTVTVGGVRLQLTVNYRSAPEILDEVERLIAPVMRPATGLQPAFQRLCAGAEVAGHRDDQRRPVEHWVAWADDDPGPGGPQTRSADARRLEARALAADLHDLHANHGLRWGSAAILLRTTTPQDIYLQELRVAGIPFAVERDRSYYRRREVIDAASLVRAIIDPADQVALVALLRSPLCGVPDAALLPLWRAQLPELVSRLAEGADAGGAERERQGAAEDESSGEREPPGPDDATRGAVERAIDAVVAELGDTPVGIGGVAGWDVATKATLRALAQLRGQLYAERADLLIERLRGLLLLEESQAACFLGAHRLANLERFFRRLLAGLIASDPTAVLRELRSSVAEARAEEEAPVGDTSLEAVRVMTVHKAKGLTFDHVYVLGLHSEPGRGAGAATAAEGGLLAGRWTLRVLGIPDLDFDRLLARRRTAAATEAVRTLYVAATRPRVRLVLAGRWPADEAPAPEPERAASHIALAQHRAGGRPPLETLFAGSRASRSTPRDHHDDEDVRWHFTTPPADDGDPRQPVAPAEPIGIEHATKELARLTALRANAAPRMTRPRMAPVTALAHGEADEAEAADSHPPPARSPTPAAESRERDVQRAVGTAIHRALEEIDLEARVDDALAQQRTRLERYVPAALDAGTAAMALDRCHKWIDRLAHSKALQRLRELAPLIIARELPLLLAADDGTSPAPPEAPTDALVGTIDLLYRDPASGEPVIADYKTDPVTGAEIAIRAARYAAQARQYCRAVTKGLGLERPPRFELWFLHADEIHVQNIDP